MNVSLILNAIEWQLLDGLTPARRQVGIKLVLQEAANLLFTVNLLHDHQRGVLRHGLDHDSPTLHVGTDELMRPVLMAIFVGRHIGDVIDVIFIRRIGNKANALGVRHGAGEGLSKGSVTRKFDHPRVIELIGTKVLLEVVKRYCHGIEHTLRIKPMRGMVVNLHIDTGMLALGHGILR